MATDPDHQESPPEPNHAESYDTDIRFAIPGYETLHEVAAALLTVELDGRPAPHVLCTGTGTGEEIMRLAPPHPDWHITGVDPSAPMLAVAKRKVIGADLTSRVTLLPGSVSDLPEGRRFDAATLLLVLHFLPDDGTKLAMLRAIAARLRPGAPLILADQHADLTSPEDSRLYRAWRARQIARGMPADAADAMFAGLPQVIHFIPESRLRALLTEAGFTTIQPIFRALVIGAWLAHRRSH